MTRKKNQAPQMGPVATLVLMTGAIGMSLLQMFMPVLLKSHFPNATAEELGQMGLGVQVSLLLLGLPVMIYLVARDYKNIK